MLIFTDDYFWMSWLYLLQEKFDAFDYFIKFKELVENYFDYTLKKFQIIKVGKFISHKFKEY